MGGGPSTPPELVHFLHGAGHQRLPDSTLDTCSDHSEEDLVQVTTHHSSGTQPLPAQQPQAEDQCPYKLRWSKSKVYVHPTAFLRDNVAGYLGILQRARSSFYLSWIPEHLLDTSSELEYWVKLENDPATTGDILVTIPPESTHSATSRTHAFSIPINTIYSLILRPPTLGSWYGTVLVNLFGGHTLPILYFHDDESRSTQFARESLPAALASQPPRTNLPASWGGDALLSQLRRFADVLPSKIETGLYLLNPTTEDRNAHLTPIFDDDSIFNDSSLPSRLRPRKISRDEDEDDDDSQLGTRNSILHQSFSSGASGSGSMDNVTFNLLSSFSRITQNAKSAAQLVLSHRLAKPIIPHLPKPIASLANAEPEFIRWSQQAGVEGYDVARVYLAKWASIVAAQGEQARRAETGEWDFQVTEEGGVGGGFEMVYSMYEIPRVRANRVPSQPIQLEEFVAWQDDQGKLLLSETECRRRIFQRGLAVSARKVVWLFLLGVFCWKSCAKERKEKTELMRENYHHLKDDWERDETGLKETAGFKEEDHRIDIDCRRTDRTQSYFAVPSNSSSELRYEGSDQASNMPATNRHVENLGKVLMTYNIWEKDLGYVQGMSDLCAPLYVVFEADQSLTFHAFVKLMNRMKHHFLRDQSVRPSPFDPLRKITYPTTNQQERVISSSQGMKDELSRLQRLLRLLDPALHQHFERTNSLNLFICFRWILIGFKREFSFQDVMKVWEAMWTDVCGSHTNLFVALAILEKHREPMIRYLRQFDEVLKYVNDIAMTLDCDEVLAQAEVLYLTFKSIIEKYPTNEGEEEAQGREERPGRLLVDQELRGLL